MATNFKCHEPAQVGSAATVEVLLDALVRYCFKSGLESGHRNRSHLCHEQTCSGS